MLGEVLLVTPFLGYGDLLYHTPAIRMLAKIYKGVDVWCYNTEPLENNPHIANLFRIEKDNVPNAWDFYFDSIIHMSGQHNPMLDKLHNTNMHMIDFFSLGALNISLRAKDRGLVLKWTKRDEERVRKIIGEHGLVPAGGGEKGNIVILNPARGWPSRTMPLDRYRELSERIQEDGGRVVLVGKDVSPLGFLDKGYDRKTREELDRNENKTLYGASNFPGAVDLMNRLSFHECAALYSIARAAVNTENGNMVLSCTNDTCWNIYVPSLTAPEFRLPWRKGSQHHRTVVVSEGSDTYPGSHHSNLRNDYFLPAAEVAWPSADAIFKAYRSISDHENSSRTQDTESQP
jgi:hypothetical protein